MILRVENCWGMEALANVADKKGAGELSDATTNRRDFCGDQWTIEGSSGDLYEGDAAKPGIYQGILSKSHLGLSWRKLIPRYSCQDIAFPSSLSWRTSYFWMVSIWNSSFLDFCLIGIFPSFFFFFGVSEFSHIPILSAEPPGSQVSREELLMDIADSEGPKLAGTKVPVLSMNR